MRENRSAKLKKLYTISLSRHGQVCLMSQRSEKYFSQHKAMANGRRKYLSKHSLIKHTCSWRD